MTEELERTALQIQGIEEKVSQLLTHDENIVCTVVQQTLAGPWPNAIVLTNKRFIIYRPGIVRTKFEDYLWLNLRDARLEEGLLGATLSFITAEGNRVAVERLPKDKARQAYTVAQEKEQESLEIRRQRKIEEDRAKAGGIMIGPPAAPVATPSSDPMEKLTKLRALFDAGLITQEEHDKKKAEILETL